MVSKSENPGADNTIKDEAAGRAEIEAQIAQVRAELTRLGGMIAEYGTDRLRGAELHAVEELQKQLTTLEAGVRRKMLDQPLQVIGLAALAGLVVGMVLRR